MIRAAIILFFLFVFMTLVACTSNSKSKEKSDITNIELQPFVPPQIYSYHSEDKSQNQVQAQMPIYYSSDSSLKMFQLTGVSDSEIYAFIEDYLARTNTYFSILDVEPSEGNSDSTFLKAKLVIDHQLIKKILPKNQNCDSFSRLKPDSSIEDIAKNVENIHTSFASISYPPEISIQEKDYRFMIFQLARNHHFKWNPNRIKCRYPIKAAQSIKKTKEDYSLYRFSLPLFSKDKKSVLFTIDYHCAGLCGGGETLLYTKYKGHWVEKNNSFLMQWVY